MRRINSESSKFAILFWALAIILLHALPGRPQSVNRKNVGKTAEERAARYFESIRWPRTSLQYAFLPGASLWAKSKKFVPVAQCAGDISMTRSISADCKQYLDGSEKANLQWKLEQDFKTFENQY